MSALLESLRQEIYDLRRAGKHATAIYLGSRRWCELMALPQWLYPEIQGGVFKRQTFMGIHVFEVRGDLDHVKVAI